MYDINMIGDMAVSKMQHNSVNADKTRIESLSKQPADAKKDAEMRDACEGFEAIFIQKMWQDMRASLPENTLHGSKEEKYWQSMYDQELGKNMARNGGIGLADMMMEQMTRDRVKPSEASSAYGRFQMPIPPAPLLENEGKTGAITATKQNSPPVQNFYEQMDVGGEQVSQKQSIIAPADLNVPHYTAESYTVAETMLAKDPIQANHVENNSSLMSQNLDELHAMIAPPPEPQIIRTTYTTNLPASERKNALLDRRGNIRQVAQAPVENPASQNISQKGKNISDENNFEPFEIKAPLDREYHEKLIQQAESIVQENSDLLSGIYTRYESSVQSPISSQTNTNKVNTINNVDETKNASPPLMTAMAEQTEIPVISRMPSFSEALQAGTLMASLSPEAIRKAQERVKNILEPSSNNSVVKNTAIENVLARPTTDTAAGGPVLTRPMYMEKVSALSPRMELIPPVHGNTTSGFGWRLDPFTGQRAWHTGLDIQAPANAPVKAVQDGVISFSGKDPELGNMIIIDHKNGMQTVYGHNGELLVNGGDKISAGMDIAKVGMSGRAKGNHVHFEIRHDGLPINPEPYLSTKKLS